MTLQNFINIYVKRRTIPAIIATLQLTVIIISSMSTLAIIFFDKSPWASI